MKANHFDHFFQCLTPVTMVGAFSPIYGIIVCKHHKVSNVVLDNGMMESNERRPFSFLPPPDWKKRVDPGDEVLNLISAWEFVGLYSH